MLKLDVLSAELNLWANETEQIYRATREMQYRRNATHLRYLAATLNQSSILAGVTSFNTRTGDVTLLSADVVSALGYTPVTQARTLTINGLTQDLSANRSWTISTATPNLDQVTTAGNTTTNAITVGGLTVATNLIYTDTVNGRVGIGTNTPLTTLHSEGSIRIGGTTTGVSLSILGSGGRGGTISPRADGSGIAGLLFSLTGLTTGDFRFGGTVSPSSNFGQDLGNNSEVWNFVYARTFRGRNNTAEGTTNLFSGTTSNPLILGIGGTENMRFSPTNGNVLINTTTDAGYKLDVNGTVRFSGGIFQSMGTQSLNFLTAGATAQTSDRGIFIGNGTFTPGIVNLGIGNAINIGSGNGNVAIGYAANASGGSIAITGGITGAVASGGGVAIGGTAGANAVSILGTAGGNAVSIGYGTSATSSGNVAIGYQAIANATISMAVGDRAKANHNFSVALGLGSKTSAANEFVAGGYFVPGGYGIYNVYFGSGPQGDQTNVINGESYTINGSGGFGTDKNGGNITVAGGKGTGTGTPGSIIFSTATVTTTGTTLQTLSEKMRISSAGNLLIGTTTGSGAKLTVAGSVTAASALAQGVYFNNTLVATANNDVLVGLDINPTFTNGAFTGVTNLGLRSLSGFNLYSYGVAAGNNGHYLYAVTNNTSSTDGLLHFRRSGGYNGITRFQLGGSFQLSSDDNSGEVRMNVGFGGYYSTFYSNGSEAMRIPTSRNVLIGTTTDAGFKLDVNGTARLNGLTSINTTSVANTALAIAANGPGAGNFIIQGYDSSANNRFYITASGNFRITGLTDTGIAGSDEKFRLNFSFSPTSGTREHMGLWLLQTINQTGGANGITRGLYVNPTLTSAADFRAIETTAGNIIFNGGNVGIGTTTPTEKLEVSGNVKISGNLTTSPTYTNCGLLSPIGVAENTTETIGFAAKIDPNGWWNPGTKRWTPTVPGFYFVTLQVRWDIGTLGNQINIQILKNLATVGIAQDLLPTNTGLTQTTSAIIEMNGSTDYVTFTGYTSSTTGEFIHGEPQGNWTFFNAFKIN